MKHLILAAALTSSLALVAAPAFAGGGADAHNAQQQKAKNFTTTQVGSAVRDDSARGQRNETLRNSAQNRSENGRAAVRGLPHYY